MYILYAQMYVCTYIPDKQTVQTVVNFVENSEKSAKLQIKSNASWLTISVNFGGGKSNAIALVHTSSIY